MGNKKFKFSDMIPNAWFCKLKEMSKTRSKQQRSSKKKLITQAQKPQATVSQPKYMTKNDNNNKNKKTQKFTTEIPTTIISSDYKFLPSKHSSKPPPENIMIRFPEAPPRKSTKRRISTSRSRKVPFSKPVINSRSFFLSSSESSSSETDFPDSINNNPSEFDSELDLPFPSWPSSRNCRLRSSAADIIIDLNDNEDDEKLSSAVKTTTTTTTNDGVFDVVSEMIDLRPILTKPISFDDTIFEATKHKSSSSSSSISRSSRIKDQEPKTTKNSDSSSGRKSLSGNVSSGIRLRTNSPRLASKKIQAYARKSVSSRNRHLSESFAVVKSSVDPQRDFRDSMVEMIVENNIRASKDLEELLACYLSLNSKEYHDVIVKAFEQIWFDMADIRD